MTRQRAWARVAFGDLGTWFGGGTPAKSNRTFWEGGSIPWLSPKDMGADVLADTADHISDAAVAGSSVRLVPEGSVAVVVRSGILERVLPVARVPFETTLNQDMKAVVPRRDIDPRWVAWGLRAMERDILDNCRKGGTTVASIETSRFMALTLPVPPLEEQRRIVDILEDHLSRLDAAVALLDRVLLQLDALERELIETAFGGRLTTGLDGVNPGPPVTDERTDLWELSRAPKPLPPAVAPAEAEALGAPNGWTVTSLEGATSPTRVIRYGILMPRVKTGGVVPYVEVKDLAGNTLAGKALHKTSQELDERFSGARLCAGDVVIAVRGSFERVAVVPAALEGANISRDVVRLAPLPSVHPTYLYYWLQTPTVRSHLQRHARGVAVKGVNIHTLRALPIVLPSMAGQAKIVEGLDRELTGLSKLRSEVKSQRRREAQLRRALLVAALQGRLTEHSPVRQERAEAAGV